MARDPSLIPGYRGPSGVGAEALWRDSGPAPLERAIPYQRQVYDRIVGSLGRNLGIWQPLYLQHQDQAALLRRLRPPR